MKKISHFKECICLILALFVAIAPTTALAATSKAPTKTKISTTAKKVATTKKKAKTVIQSVKISSASSKAVETCTAAIVKVNDECRAIAKGCTSWSQKPHCVEVNKICEEKQKVALALCPL